MAAAARVEQHFTDVQREMAQLRRVLSAGSAPPQQRQRSEPAAQPAPRPPQANPMGMWAETPLAPPDPIFGLAAQYKADPSPDKADLVVGAYRTDEGKPYLLPSVAEAERRLAATRASKAYADIDGLRDFTRASAALVLGPDSPALKENRVALCQSLSGTGALAICASLYSQFLPIRTKVLLSRPTWANHKQIFEFFGFSDIAEYRYWDAGTRGLDFQGMLEDLREAPQRSIVVLHLCAHNPTGCDPTLEQWRIIGRVIWERKHHVVFDSAYQGYATGDLDRDAWPARLFEQEIGLEFALTQSYSKNMGLYGERIGCFSYITRSATAAERILSQVRAIVRVSYSNPPIHGARIVTMLLTDKQLRQQWGAELKAMSRRIIGMRALLRGELERLGAPGTWNHITEQIGMFSFTGLTARQCDHVTRTRHVYMLRTGRVSMAGITSHNVAYIAKAIFEATQAYPEQEQPPALALGNPPAQAEPAHRIEARMPSPVGMWAQLTEEPPDKIFGIHQMFQADPDPRKINLAVVADSIRIGGMPMLLPTVSEAERRLAEIRMQKEYAPIDGDRKFCVAAAKLVLGADSPAVAENRVALCQSISGTGALSMISSFYSRFLPIQTAVMLSDPTWHNHVGIFRHWGFMNLVRYRYWSKRNQGLDFPGMLEDLRSAPRRSIIVLQLCAHNPTGVDPTRAQWRAVAEVCRDRRHHIVLDNAYQGSATGDVEADAWPARMFEREYGLEFAVAMSFSKPMGLYGERIGAFMYVTRHVRAAECIQSQVKVIARRLYSNPPLHGARIVTMILSDAELCARWHQEVREMVDRIRRLRGALRAEIVNLGTPGPHMQRWEHLERQVGMFSYTGLTPPQLNHMREQHRVYMPLDGRMSIPGLTSKTADYVASAIADAVNRYPFPKAGKQTQRSRL